MGLERGFACFVWFLTWQCRGWGHVRQLPSKPGACKCGGWFRCRGCGENGRTERQVQLYKSAYHTYTNTRTGWVRYVLYVRSSGTFVTWKRKIIKPNELLRENCRAVRGGGGGKKTSWLMMCFYAACIDVSRARVSITSKWNYIKVVSTRSRTRNITFFTYYFFFFSIFNDVSRDQSGEKNPRKTANECKKKLS